MSTTLTSSSARPAPHALLWLSAVVLTALIIIQAASPGPAARADLVSNVDDYTTLTFNAGNDDVLLVLDGRAEELYAYRVKNQNSFELIEPYDLKTLFANGRRIGAGTK